MYLTILHQLPGLIYEIPCTMSAIVTKLSPIALRTGTLESI